MLSISLDSRNQRNSLPLIKSIPVQQFLLISALYFQLNLEKNINNQFIFNEKEGRFWEIKSKKFEFVPNFFRDYLDHAVINRCKLRQKLEINTHIK